MAWMKGRTATVQKGEDAMDKIVADWNRIAKDATTGHHTQTEGERLARCEMALRAIIIIQGDGLMHDIAHTALNYKMEIK